jgi:hypothetical protein
VEAQGIPPGKALSMAVTLIRQFAENNAAVLRGIQRVVAGVGLPAVSALVARVSLRPLQHFMGNAATENMWFRVTHANAIVAYLGQVVLLEPAAAAPLASVVAALEEAVKAGLELVDSDDSGSSDGDGDGDSDSSIGDGDSVSVRVGRLESPSPAVVIYGATPRHAPIADLALCTAGSAVLVLVVLANKEALVSGHVSLQDLIGWVHDRQHWLLRVFFANALRALRLPNA